MAFIYRDLNVVSFAEYQDVLDHDQRLFDSNEGLSDSIIDAHLIRATERILNKIRSTDWWIGYYVNQSDQPYNTRASIPALDANRIIGRQNDFTDLCVYTAMAEYILPVVADFGSDDNAEYRKMQYYVTKSDKLFAELIQAGDWYDFNDDGIIQDTEKQTGIYNLRRIR